MRWRCRGGAVGAAAVAAARLQVVALHKGHGAAHEGAPDDAKNDSHRGHQELRLQALLLDELNQGGHL
jgi:hypothetical protein